MFNSQHQQTPLLANTDIINLVEQNHKNEQSGLGTEILGLNTETFQYKRSTLFLQEDQKGLKQAFWLSYHESASVAGVI